MRSVAFRLALGVPLAIGFAGTASAGPLGFALGNDGTTLLRFDVNRPGSARSVSLSGAGSQLQAIDFRPATGQLFGYDDVANAYYIVDPRTGVLTSASSIVTPTNTPILDMDWNPTIDRLRVVTASDQNIVYNPETGTASNSATTPLFYGPGDPNAGTDPSVAANGYTNSFAGSTSTVQYALDYDLNTLVTLANNAGTLATVGTVTIMGTELDFGPNGGLDVFSAPPGTNIAYALLTDLGTPGAGPGLYSINLGSGAATPLGSFDGALGTIDGLAVTVPEPTSLALLMFGGLGLFIQRRARRRPNLAT